MLKNRVTQEIADAIVALAIEQPAFGRVRVANELRKRGLVVSPAGARGLTDEIAHALCYRQFGGAGRRPVLVISSPRPALPRRPLSRGGRGDTCSRNLRAKAARASIARNAVPICCKNSSTRTRKLPQIGNKLIGDGRGFT